MTKLMSSDSELMSINFKPKGLMMKKNDLKARRELRRREAYKEFILHAAESVIVRRGYAMMTMDDVAREAGLSKATVYRYVSGKRDLIYQIIIHYYDDQKKRLDAILAGEGAASGKLREAIRSVLKAGVHQMNISRFFLADKVAMKIMNHMTEAGKRSASSPEHRFFKSMSARRAEVLGTAQRIIKEGIAAGEFRPIDPATAASLVEALLQGTLHLHFWDDIKRGLEPETDMIIDFVINGIRNPKGPGQGE